MNNAEITAKLRDVARDVDDLLANISTGKDISVVLTESREAKNAAPRRRHDRRRNQRRIPVRPELTTPHQGDTR